MKPPTLLDKGSSYLFEWEEEEISIDVSKIHQHKDGRVTSEIVVTTSALDYEPHLMQGGLNLLSRPTRKHLAKDLEELYRKGTDWGTMLEQLCTLSLRRFREGQPAIEVWGGRDTGKPLGKHEQLLEPLLYKNKPNLLFGDGGVGKSKFALAVAIIVQLPIVKNNLGFIPERANTLYLDYETDEEDFQLDLDSLVRGFDVPPVSILYRRCSLPFVQELSEIQSIVSKNQISFLIVDSIGMATAEGKLNESESATSFFSALRRLKVTSLILHHVSKQSEGKKTPYGSVYYRNLVRNAFEIRYQQEPGEDTLSIALLHDKCNLGRRITPLGFEFHFNENCTTLKPQNILEMPALEQVAPLGMRIADLLKEEGKMKAKDIAEALDAPQGTTRKQLHRMADKGFLVQLKKNEWAVKSLVS